MDAPPLTARQALHTRKYVALVELHSYRRVARALNKLSFQVSACTPAGLLEHLSGPQGVCVVVDPALLTADQIREALALIERLPRVVAIYASLTTGGVHGALEFARFSRATVLFQSTEDDPVALARALIAIAEPSYTHQLLSGLSGRLELLPQHLSTAISDIFVEEAGLGSAKSLARRACLTRRSLDRWLDRIGIASTRLLVAAPGLLKAVSLLRNTELPIRRVAQLSGYTSVRRLADHAIELTGYTPLELRTAVSAEDVINRMLRRLIESAEDRDGDTKGAAYFSPEPTVEAEWDRPAAHSAHSAQNAQNAHRHGLFINRESA